MHVYDDPLVVDIGTIAEMFKLLRTAISIDSGQSIENIKKNYLAIFKLFLTKHMIFHQKKESEQVNYCEPFC